MRWPQMLVDAATAGNLSRELTSMTGPFLYLVAPDGKVSAAGLDGRRAFGVLGDAVRPPADQRVTVEHVPRTAARPDSPYQVVPPPAAGDAASGVRFTLVDGVLRSGDGAGTLQVLHDGKTPTSEDSPPEVAFFEWATLEGRFSVDLGTSLAVTAINTYSWHSHDRAPQVYKVYGSDGSAEGFDASPKIGANPAGCGWALVATVDTRPQTGPPGGRYGVSISSDSAGGLGTYRYLLFLVFATETQDDWGHTFYGEVDVVANQ